MLFKLSTKQKFHVITLTIPALTAIMTESMVALFNLCLQTNVKSIILNVKEVQTMDIEVATAILQFQEQTYDVDNSFMVCQLQPQLEKYLDEQGIMELLNYCITESEAGDIIQMEEVEREMMREDD